MFLIQPCCTQKELLELRRKLGSDGTCFVHGYGDLSLSELLPVLLTRYTEVQMMIVCPHLPDKAAEVISRLMEKKWPTPDGKRRLDTIRCLTLVTSLTKKRSPMASAWVKQNPFGDRLVLKNIQQNDTAVILPDIALIGPLNLVYGGHFTALATKCDRTIRQLRDEFMKLG